MYGGLIDYQIKLVELTSVNLSYNVVTKLEFVTVIQYVEKYQYLTIFNTTGEIERTLRA